MIVKYLADSSVLKRLTRSEVNSRFTSLAQGNQVALTSPVKFEIAFSARNGDEHADILDALTGFPHSPTIEADVQRAVEIQGLLAERASHRSISLVDALLAATAETRDLTVLHYDADFELISEVTGQPNEWVVPRGSVA